jgi:hypothetical protein
MDSGTDRDVFAALIDASRTAFGETFWEADARPSSSEPTRSRAARDRRVARRPPFLFIPWVSVERVGRLRGKALLLYVMVWRQGLLEQTRTVTLTSTACLRCGVSRHQKASALAELEAHGFITVERHHGSNPVVTLLEESYWKA